MTDSKFYKNPKVRDPFAVFKGIARDGEKREMKGGPVPGTIIESHVQGGVRYKTDNNGYFIATHNNKGHEFGWLVFHDLSTFKTVNLWKITNAKNYNHPGGLQTIGDYLALAIEKSDYKKSKILFYDISAVNSDNGPRPLGFSIEMNNNGTGCVGIVDIDLNENEMVYYVVAHSGGVNRLFRSNLLSKNTETIEDISSFSYIGEFPTYKFQGIGLLSDLNNNVKLVGFRSKGEGTSYKDYVHLYSITITEESINSALKATEHIKTKHGGIIGIDGVHCRWGSGLEVRGERDIRYWVTQRNYVAGLMMTNIFNPG